MQVMRATVSTGDTDAVLIDANTHALLVIDYAHHEIHEGSHFACIATQELSNAEVVSFTLTVPDDVKLPHLDRCHKRHGGQQLDLLGSRLVRTHS